MDPIQKGFADELAKIAAGETLFSPAGLAGAVGGHTEGGMLGALIGAGAASVIPAGEIGAQAGEALLGPGVGTIVGKVLAPVIAGYLASKVVNVTSSMAKSVARSLAETGRTPNPPPPPNYPYPNPVQHALG